MLGKMKSYYPSEFLPLRLSNTRMSMYPFPRTTDIKCVGKAQAGLLATLLHAEGKSRYTDGLKQAVHCTVANQLNSEYSLRIPNPALTPIPVTVVSGWMDRFI
jgi:hypothetical protein